jgi:hypothetical protein
MSGINGDKARFHRKRKSKIARRARNNKLFQNSPPKSEAKTSRANTSAVSE